MKPIKKVLQGLICGKCGLGPDAHQWRCVACDEPLEKDADGLPIFEGHLFAELACPPDPANLN